MTLSSLHSHLPLFIFPRTTPSTSRCPSTTCRRGWAARPSLSTTAPTPGSSSSPSNSLPCRGSRSWRWAAHLIAHTSAFESADRFVIRFSSCAGKWGRNEPLVFMSYKWLRGWFVTCKHKTIKPLIHTGYTCSPFTQTYIHTHTHTGTQIYCIDKRGLPVNVGASQVMIFCLTRCNSANQMVRWL